jgi:hypothetical protein
MDRKYMLVLAACLMLFCGAALKPSSLSHDLSWHVIAGGGERMESGSYTLMGTTGQPATDLMFSGGYVLCSGFWCGGAGAERVYLPLVLRSAGF